MAEEDIPAGEALVVVHTVVVIVDRITEVAAAATTDGTAPEIGTVAETTRTETPARLGTIRIGTRGRIIVQVVALTSATTRIRTRETVVPRTESAHGQTIPLREVVVIMAQVVAAQEITIAGTAADQVAVEAHPAGIMTVAAHPTINVAMIIIRRRRSEVVAAAALVVIGSIIAAAVGDAAEALAETDPGNRWDRRGRSLHAAPLVGDHR